MVSYYVFNWKRKQHTALREKTFPLQKEFIVLDSIRFGIRESEMRHQIEGGFTDPYCPTGIIQLDSQEHIDIDALNHEEIIRWRNVADKFCFEMTIPQGASLDNLYLELCLRRYPHRNYNAPVQPTYITVSTSQKLYPHTEFLLPFDRKWHLYTFELKEIASSTLGTRISFFINDRKNFLSVDEHYGCSVSYAKLFCTNNKSISPQNLRTKINSYSITDSDVILVMCPVWDVTMPPISIACIASYLRSKGINPFIFDFNIESFQESSHDRRDL